MRCRLRCGSSISSSLELGVDLFRDTGTMVAIVMLVFRGFLRI